MLEREYRELSFVPRWTIIRTLRQQSVAEHSYYVALYTDMLWDLIGGIDGSTKEEALVLALYHDMEEVFMGDTPGPSKRATTDYETYNQYCRKQLARRFGGNHVKAFSDSVDLKALIKVADLMDEVMFLATDISMGNKNLATVYAHSLRRLEAEFTRLPRDAAILKNVWATEILPAINHNHSGNSETLEG